MQICKKVMACDDGVKDVFIVNSDARLIAFSGGEEMSNVDEARLAEMLEDLLFMAGSRRHYEDLFGRLEYIHIKHRDVEFVIFPFEKDKVLCASMKPGAFNDRTLLARLKTDVEGMYQYI